MTDLGPNFSAKAFEDHVRQATDEALFLARAFPIYVAGRMERRGMFRLLRHDWRALNINILSSWIDAGDDHDEQSPLTYAGAWINNLREITQAKALVVYGAETEILRGALVEVGMALGQQKPVILVDPAGHTDHKHPRWGSWQYHPYVHATDTFDGAAAILRRWVNR